MKIAEVHLSRLLRSARASGQKTYQRFLEVVQRLKSKQRTAVENTVYFEGTLPPEGALRQELIHADSEPDGLIVASLSALERELTGVPAGSTPEHALPLAYQALNHLARGLAAYSGVELGASQVRLHAVMVEYANQSYASRSDGTLYEIGTGVRLVYRSWTVDHAQPPALTEALLERCHSLWPTEWVAVPGGIA
jgi:hypothetical protein